MHIQLPDYFADEDGCLTTVYVVDPCWLYAWQTTIECGASLLSVYRSTWLQDTDNTYRPVVGLLDRLGAKLIHTETIEDHDMVHYHAELSRYDVSISR